MRFCGSEKIYIQSFTYGRRSMPFFIHLLSLSVITSQSPPSTIDVSRVLSFIQPYHAGKPALSGDALSETARHIQYLFFFSTRQILSWSNNLFSQTLSSFSFHFSTPLFFLFWFYVSSFILIFSSFF